MGDVTPVTPLARTLTVGELIVGFFYTIGFLSRVVSVHLAHLVTKKESEKKPHE